MCPIPNLDECSRACFWTARVNIRAPDQLVELFLKTPKLTSGLFEDARPTVILLWRRFPTSQYWYIYTGLQAIVSTLLVAMGRNRIAVCQFETIIRLQSGHPNVYRSMLVRANDGDYTERWISLTINLGLCQSLDLVSCISLVA